MLRAASLQWLRPCTFTGHLRGSGMQETCRTGIGAYQIVRVASGLSQMVTTGRSKIPLPSQQDWDRNLWPSAR